jgi:cytoskeleton protein RodZ
LLEASNLLAPAAAPIQQLAPTIGELPLETGSGRMWTRWLIPSGLALVLIAGFTYYELTRVPTSDKKARKETTEAIVAPPATSSEAAAGPATGPSADSGAPRAPVANTAPAAPALGAATGEQSTAATTGRLDLEFAGPSWVEVRDAQGEILLSRTLSTKDRQTLTGTLPLSLRIGNASVVRLQFDGSPIDLAPHTHLEIARLTLPPQRP